MFLVGQKKNALLPRKSSVCWFFGANKYFVPIIGSPACLILSPPSQNYSPRNFVSLDYQSTNFSNPLNSFCASLKKCNLIVPEEKHFALERILFRNIYFGHKSGLTFHAESKPVGSSKIHKALIFGKLDGSRSPTRNERISSCENYILSTFSKSTPFR